MAAPQPFPRPFRFRLNCIDHYRATPTPLDPPFSWNLSASQAKTAPQVPVIRVFGATETGQKVCAHVHGVLPYLYLLYEGGLRGDEVREYIDSLTLAINHALAVSYRRNPFDPQTGTYVAHVTLVKGIPFYGYHVGYKHFLKVYLLNPNCTTRLADLLVQGAVLARPLQPYEAHLQYLAQFMCDYNLFGCGNVDCDKVRFRVPVPESATLDVTTHIWHSASIRREWVLNESEYPRQSHCAIEIDVCAQDIINRREVRPRYLHHDFQERFHELGPDEKFVHSVAGLWRDETLRRKRKMGITDPSSSPFPPEVLVSMSADPRAEGAGGWIHEEEYEDLVQQLIEQERVGADKPNMDFDDWIQQTGNISGVQTAFESINDLYPEKLLRTERYGDASQVPTQLRPALVNEGSIPQVEEDPDSAYNSDEEIAREIALTQKAGEPDSTQEKSLQAALGGDQGRRTNANIFSFQTRLHEDGVAAGPQAQLLRSSPLSGRKRKEAENAEIMSEIETTKRRKLFQSQIGVQPDGLQLSPRDAKISGAHTTLLRSRVAFDESPLVGQQYSAEDYEQSPTDPSASQSLSSSQLSQGSIKAQGVGGPSSLAFQVVKNINDTTPQLKSSQHSEQQTKISPSTPASKQQAMSETIVTPQSADDPKASDESPTTPWTAIKSRPAGPWDGVPYQIVELARSMQAAFPALPNDRSIVLTRLPPTTFEVEGSFTTADLPAVIYRDAYYSDESDVPERPREYAGKEFRLESDTVPFLPEFNPSAVPTNAMLGRKLGIVRDIQKEEIVYNQRRKMCSLKVWEYEPLPPTRDAVQEWLNREHSRPRTSMNEEENSTPRQESQEPANLGKQLSQVDGPTQKGKHGFKYSQKRASTSVRHETQYMSIMSLEVHVNTRSNLAPDPAEDCVQAVFWRIQVDQNHDPSHGEAGYETGVVMLETGGSDATDCLFKKIAHQRPGLIVDVEETELDLFNRMIDIVRRHDPDILTGYEVHNFSWGYLIERARLAYEYDLCDEFSRMKSQSHGRFGKEADRWGFTHTSTIRVTGRHMINIWRAMRGELNLLQYTLENVAFHVLHRRVPHYPFTDLTQWYKDGTDRDLNRVMEYYFLRTRLNLNILDATELIPRTSEQARLLGVDFFSVFSRGSQFKVESLMFRIAKPENYILVSPSRKQVGQQNALECLPLVMEPQSDFYTSPLLVLDFQSLYPSVMIAYNYCYSTCLGRIVNWRGTNKLGFTSLKRDRRLLELLDSVNGINIAPNGLMYVKPFLRKSLLAKMLSEILETRIMVKSGMKQDKEDKTLQRLLNNRQLALKLIANVTYGYTSASFSGRMPCSEIADSIVQTARETLEKAIALIHSVERWGAEVVYGDTDSLFVYLKGRTRAQAFEIGREIADTVTKANPRPVKLKFEKVYHPCVLLAKKRYVGFKYETPAQTEPEFDAKGIETVRRDGTPAEQKIEEKALKILFRTSDLSQVKRFFQAQCRKIMEGRVSIQDFLFAKEVKLGTYSDRGPPPPGALIATRRMLTDPRREPQYGERVPYVVITGAPGARLIDRCVDPEALLKDDAVELDAEYYIGKNLIPPLERIFNLVGANVRGWWEEMPKLQRVRNASATTTMTTGNARTLESYLHTTICIVCRAKLPPLPARAPWGLVTQQQQQQQQRLPLCTACAANPPPALATLRARLNAREASLRDVTDVCRSCAGLAFGEQVRCDSRDCPVFYTRVREQHRMLRERDAVGGVVSALEGMGLEDGGGRALEW